MNVYHYQQATADATTANTMYWQVSPCNCNATGCPHWQPYTFTVSYSSSEAVEAQPKPRPWIVERVPVIPRFKSNDALPWRPARQRTRSGTLVRDKTGGLYKLCK